MQGFEPRVSYIVEKHSVPKLHSMIIIIIIIMIIIIIIFKLGTGFTEQLRLALNPLYNTGRPSTYNQKGIFYLFLFLHSAWKKKQLLFVE